MFENRENLDGETATLVADISDKRALRLVFERPSSRPTAATKSGKTCGPLPTKSARKINTYNPSEITDTRAKSAR